MIECKYVVIGSGQSGLKAVTELLPTKQKIVLIEQGEFGGSYLNSYELPKKILKKYSDEFLISLKDFKNTPETFSVIRSHRQKIAEKITEEIEAYKNKRINFLEKTGQVTILTGQAEFSSRSLIEVNSETVRDLVSFEKVIIATGKNGLIKTEIKGLEKTPFLYKHNAFRFLIIPSNLAIIGFTKESLEVASIYSGLGIKVEIFETKEISKAVPKLDKTALNYLLEKVAQRQIRINFETEIKEVEYKKTSLVLKDQNRTEYKFSHIYLPTKETLSSSSLNLNVLKISHTKKGIKGSYSGKTAQNNVWVFGEALDVNTSYNKLSNIYNYCLQEVERYTKNSMQILQLPNYFNQPEVMVLDYRQFFFDIFSPVLSIGLSEHNAEAIHGAHVESELIQKDFKEGFIKLIYRKNSDIVLGITITGDFYTDLHSYCKFCIKNGVTTRQFKSYLRGFYDI